ncbi:hypothetical protein MAR_023274 [Mya arenaria]|uniref:Uncharacterized protein n=1 Tax=Mya arenaria TaxID=6604 RepID=A0ABY7DQN6_MYAAR|nr:hypothetical protein MAR_023274 [Mya arenaria]
MNATNESFNPEHKAAYIVTEKLKTFYPPVLMIFGIFGNRTSSSTRLLLISLAVTDSLVLLNSVLKKRCIDVALPELIQCLSVMNKHILSICDLIFEQHNKRVICFPRIETFVFKIWTWLDLALALGIPFCVLLTGNLTIWISI